MNLFQDDYTDHPTDWTLLAERPTINVGHTDDLKYDDGKTRVWLSRCGVADGMTSEHTVTVERHFAGRWVTVRTIEED